MGRRNLDNIERKIIKQTIRLGALNGVDHISTIELSEKLGISEGTIFVHFKTKENLIYEAYKFSGSYLKDTIYNELIKAETFDDLYVCWKKVVDLLFEKPNLARFLYNFFISKYLIKFAFRHEEKEIGFVNKWLQKSGNSPVEDNLAMILWYDIYFATLRYVMLDSNIEELDKRESFKYLAFQSSFARVFVQYRHTNE